MEILQQNVIRRKIQNNRRRRKKEVLSRELKIR
jgi:hypothetical protein